MIVFAGWVRGRAERSEASGIHFRIGWRSERMKTYQVTTRAERALMITLEKGSDLVV